MNLPEKPALVIEYLDPLEEFRGWLVIDSLDHGLAAGGMRVCRGLCREDLEAMARNMTRKMRIADLGLDGAKCGIDYDPLSPGKLAAMTRFISAISPYVRERYSMGPDLNVNMDELHQAGAEAGIESVKMAVARAMGWELDYFLDRYRVLQADVGGKKLGQVRAGYGVAGAALACLDFSGIAPAHATMAVQGAGTLAHGALHGLKESGIKLVAISDAEKTLICDDGIDIDRILAHPPGLLPDPSENSTIKALPRDEILRMGCDLLMPLAVEGVITAANAYEIRAKAVVPGANLAITPEGYSALFSRGIIAVPAFLAGAGGSISMEGLFRPAGHPAPEEVLEHVIKRGRELTLEVMNLARQRNITPFEAALEICRGRERKKSGYR